MKALAVPAALLAVSIAGCDSPLPPSDGGTDAILSCGAPDACDDGLFCTGIETCVMGRCNEGTSPCRAGQTCDEASQHCFTTRSVSEDADGDDARAQIGRANG